MGPRQRRKGPTISLRGAFLAVALASIVPFVLLVAYLAYDQLSRERTRVQQQALVEAGRLGSEIERHVGARLESVAGAASAVAGSGNSAGVMEAQARRLRQTFRDIERVTIVDELGAILLAQPAGSEGRRTVADLDWFKRAATSTEGFAGTPTQKGPDGVVGLYAPGRAPEGNLRAVVAADLALKRVQDFLAQARLIPGGVAELLSDSAVVIARQPALYLMRDVRDSAGYAELARRGGGTGDLVFEDGERRLTGAVLIQPFQWVLAVGLPAGPVLAETRRSLAIVGGVAIVLAVGGVVGALALARRNTAGMQRLRTAMGRLEGGDLPASLPVAAGGEVAALTDAFNRMVNWLRGRLREYEALSQVEEAAAAPLTGEQAADGILPGLLRKVVAGMAADAGVMLIHEEGGALVTKAAVGFPGIPTDGVTLRRGQGVAGAVGADHEPVLVEDVASDYRVEEPYLKTSAIRSLVGVPMLSGDQLVGVLEVGYRLPHAFPPVEVQRLSAMARRAAQAIERARAIDAVQRSTQGLEAQLAEQLEALQAAASEQAEARRQAQEARGKAQELEQRMQARTVEPPAPAAPEVREVIVEREVVRVVPTGADAAQLRAALQKTVTEEFRVPLAALLDLPRFLVEGLEKPLSEEEARQLEILQERGQEILELIESLVILTGLEARRVKVARAPFELPTVIHRVVRALQPRAAAKGNRIDADIKTSVGRVVSDAKRVEQILTNLLLTAIRYTEVGEIRVTCYARDADVVLTVADDGVGFSPEEQARMFEPFLPVGPRGGRSLPGTGLLLAVCQRLADVLGGRIRVESEVDRGTWFTVTLPAGT